MTLIADILLIAGAVGAGFYCLILARRLNRFNDLGSGVGGAIAVLSAQVDDMTKALESANGAARTSAEGLETLTARAEAVARRLELLVASMHDLPSADAARDTAQGADKDTGQDAEPDPTPGPVSAPDEAQAPEDADTSPTLFLSRRARIKEAAE